MGIRVKALERGVYGSLREPGDEFVIASEKDLGKWMVPVSKLPKRGAQTDTPDAEDNPLP